MTPNEHAKNPIRRWLDAPVLPGVSFTREAALFLLILLVAAVTRFYDLGTRVMSHDESLHTYFSWTLSQGQGYQHTPMMHGPFQFHGIALVYFLFGASDFTARIPAALMSIGTIAALWYWRRYLGKTGTLLAAFFMVISPYLLYYGRYVRNEAYVGLFGVLMLYALLRYLETPQTRYLYLLTLAATLHFASKETSFIYVAQALLFLGVYLLFETLNQPESWERPSFYSYTIFALIAAILLGASSLTLTFNEWLPKVLLAAAFIALLGAAGFLIAGYGWKQLKHHPAFDLIIVLATLVLPQLAPLPLHVLGWTVPTDAAQLQALTLPEMLRFGSMLLLFSVLAVALGLSWNRRIWPKIALIFYGIFLILFTTLLTNGAGFFSGMVGSLGYWLAQQEVQRGGQPWYYYILIQIPLYEFLPALGVWLAAFIGWRRFGRKPVEWRETAPSAETVDETAEAASEALPASPRLWNPHPQLLFLLLLGWWTVSSVVAYSVAGERMPWLTYHIALPMILLTGWALGHLIEDIDFKAIRKSETWLALGLSLVFVIAAFNALRAWNAPIRPFSGKDLWALEKTANFTLSLLVAVGTLIWVGRLLPRVRVRELLRLGLLAFFTLLTALTVRTSFRAAYVTYDQATEYLVYAHSATGVKDVMKQIEELSFRLYGDRSIPVAYDASPPDTGISWPFSWYFRDYTNVLPFAQPDSSLRERDVVLVDAKNFDKIESVLRDQYYRFDYIRMWWPNQDYFYLVSPRDPQQPFSPDYACRGPLGFLKLFKSRDFTRVCNAVLNPDIRRGIFEIWLNRDYTRYGQATGNPDAVSLAHWSPSDPMRMYIKKDIVQRLWPYGAPAVQTESDPYLTGMQTLAAVRVVGAAGSEPGLFNAPRGIAFAPDGTFYVADSLNHRIQHFDSAGNPLGAFGTFGNIEIGDAPGGTFNEPWGVAVAPDGSIYVADTWNHRIQKFDANGNFVTMWGYWGQDGSPTAFYGPRAVAVGPDGRVFVSDTGNKRIVVFDMDGNYLTQIGTGGFEPGQLDEPVGVAVDAAGRLYVADTWNQRVQVFTPLEEGSTEYVLERYWDVSAWFSQDGENKPYLAVGPDGSVFITDPQGYRVLQFDANGQFVRGWGEYGISAEGLNLPTGIAVAPDGSVWVSDSDNHRVLKFVVPQGNAAPANP